MGRQISISTPAQSPTRCMPYFWHSAAVLQNIIILAFMQEDRYKVETSFDLNTFEFISEGPKGRIEKVVVYTEINLKNVYNLSFGDKDPLTGFLNDLTVTNNGDS